MAPKKSDLGLHDPVLALAPTESLYEAIVQSASDAIFTKSLDGTIASWNAGAERLYGYTAREIIGRTVVVLAPPEQADEIPALLARIAAGERIEHFETVRVRRDGSHVDVSLTISPIRDTDGRIVGASSVARDIGARKAAERGLAESEERFRTVLEASPNAMFGVGSDGRITFANPEAERAFGYRHDELIGLVIEALIPERHGERHLGYRDAFLTNPRARPMRAGMALTGRRKDGAEFPVEISLSPVSSGLGTEVFATVIDITARKTIEAELLQAQKLESIGRLAGGIAHDFNNLMFAIRGFADMLTEDLAPENRQSFDHDAALESVGTINLAAERASVLTAQLLAFSRRQPVSPRSIDLNASVVAIEPMLRRLIGEDIELKMSLGGEIGAVLADPGQLDQILVNLVVNARDAILDGGSVTIGTRGVTFEDHDPTAQFEVEPGRYVQLSVSDTGVGMDRETREHIFEPFFTTKDVGKGTGLGLATIYGIVRQAGGHVWVYSEPGHGSTFKLYFPRHDAGPESVPKPVAARPGRRQGTVMLVEDEEPVRLMMTRLLERAGYEVLPMADTFEALAQVSLGRGKVDVLVTDVVMPGMSGIMLAEQMVARHPKMGLVLVSGYIPEALDLRALVARGARFVSKPVPSSEFVAAVDGAMAERLRTAAD